MKILPNKSSAAGGGDRERGGMTFMEVVNAIGIVGFILSIILMATAFTTSSRLSAEANMRSAWLAKDVRRELLSKWVMPEREPESLCSPAHYPLYRRLLPPGFQNERGMG